MGGQQITENRRGRKNTYAIMCIIGVVCCLVSATSKAQEGYNAKMNIDSMWIVISAALIYLMQLGFMVIEVACGRKKNVDTIVLKNVGDWCVSSVVYYFVGFALMFGTSYNGLFGTTFWLCDGIGTANPRFSWDFFFFQLAFAGTSATIIAGAMGERTSLWAYLAVIVGVGAFTYPIFGHWAWGTAFLASNKPWLAEMGFVDFAGSAVVHQVGAYASLVGIWFVGPRIGRYTSDGRPQSLDSGGLVWFGIGVFILWFGWLGFNGGSALEYGQNVGYIIVNTDFAGSTGGFTAFVYAYFWQGKRDMGSKMLGGMLGGLVAITACCHVVTPGSALVIGLVAGVVHNICYEFVLFRLKLDDVVGALPVHGACGVLGVLSVALFGDAALLPKKNFIEQLGVQALGCAVCFIWTVTTTFIILSVVKLIVGLRVPAMEEIEGLRVDGLGDE